MLPIAIASATFSLQALAQVVSLSNATISPDASHVAFVATRADESRNRYDDTLEILTLAPKSTRAVEAAHASVGNLAWSPNSEMLAAVLEDRNGTDQLFVIDPRTGGQRQLTHGSQDVVQIAWDPSGGRLAFTRQEPRPAASGAARYADGFAVDDNAYLDEAPARPYHLWLVDLRGDERRMTSGSLSVMDDQLSWSRDGRSILFELGPAPHGLHDRAYSARLDVATQSLSQVTEARSGEQAVFAPDDAHIAYIAPQGGDLANQDDAFVTKTGSKAAIDLSVQMDRQVSTLAWMPDGKRVLEQTDDDAQSPLVEQTLSRVTRRLPLGPVVAAQIQREGSVARDGTIVFVGDQPQRPDELYLLRPRDGAPRQLTSFNERIARLDLGRVQRITWRSVDGFAEDGVLTYPPGYDPQKSYPLVLRIHGGPYIASTTAFSAFYQFAASHGYLVFAPNYRGSTDLGNAYERAIINDPNEGPSRDILDGINAVEQLGSVDRSRIAVSGWSYGGQLTSWLEGHYHFWRAAVAGAAVDDLVLDYATADDIDADRLMFTRSSPFKGQALDVWRAQSPLTYFEDIRTPTLLFSNVYDVRVPIAESYEMFHALEDNGVPVKFYAYPTAGHEPEGPVREADVWRRWLSWLDAYLK